jgi:RND family efflux transporter MFP subunit
MKSQYLYIAAIAALLSSCNSDDKSNEAAAEQLPRIEIDVAHSRSVPQVKTYTATVEADNINNISPSSPNRIKTITVEVGDRVHKGQTLATLDPVNINQTKLNLEQTKREYDRAVTLLEIGAGTQQSVEQLKTQLDVAQTQYNNLLENAVLTSPINGIVTARNYDPGDMSSTLPIVTVGQLSPIVKVMINVSENDLTLVRAGMNVDVTFDAFPDETFNGKIERIHPTVDTTTRTFAAEVHISNRDERILPGMFARVNINLGNKDNVVVPDRAIVKQTGSGNRYVYTFSNGTVGYHKVELGQRLDDAYELLSGINDGDTVVIAGQTKLADGVKAEVVKR